MRGGRERAGGEGAVAGLAVARDGLHQRAEQRARARGWRASRCQRHALAPAEEARAEHVVGAAARDRVEHALEVGRVVLAVAVEVDGGGVALVARRSRGPVRSAAPRPREVACESTRAPCSRAIAAVASREPSSTTSTSTGRPHASSGMPASTPPTRGLLVACHDDREAALPRRAAPRPPARPGIESSAGTSGLPARGRGACGTPSSARDGRRQLAAPSAARGEMRARHGALAPHHERHRPLAPVEVAVAADPATLAVVGHQDHGGAVELAALLEEGEEVADVAVGLGELVEVLAGCARRARGRAGRRRAAGARAGPGPPPRPRARALRGERAVDLRRSAARR